MNGGALNAKAASVNEPHVGETGGECLVQILVDQGWDVAGGEGVEVERRLDWNANRVLILHGNVPLEPEPAYCSYRTVTSVLIPPRTEKSPTTVIRRGLHAETRSSRI